METGDLCADTAPMPKSKMCQDPGAVSDTCGVATYQGTPYNNYMSYTGAMNTSWRKVIVSNVEKNIEDGPYKYMTRHIHIHVMK